MKRTILIILAAALLLAAYGCKVALPEDSTEKLTTEEATIKEETTEEIMTEEVITENPFEIYKSKVHNRIARDAEDILDKYGISPGDMFFMSYSEAISRFVTPTKINIYSCEEALKSGALSKAEEKDLLDKLNIFKSENLYVYEFRGRVMQNPDIPYLISDEETVLRIVIIYDDSAELVGYSTLEVNDSLWRCVTIAVTQF